MSTTDTNKPMRRPRVLSVTADWLSALAARWVASQFSVRYFFAGATLLYFVGMESVAPGLLEAGTIKGLIVLYMVAILGLHGYARLVRDAHVDRLFYLIEAPVLGLLIAQDPVPAMPLQLLLLVDLLDHGMRFGLRRLVVAGAGLGLADAFALVMRAIAGGEGLDPSAGWVLFILLSCAVYLLTLVGSRDRAERRAREAQERIAGTVSAAGIGIWTDDLVVQRLHWDENTQRLAGLSGQAFGGSYDEFLRLLPKTDAEHFLRARKAAIESRTPLSIEYRVIWADGSEHTIGSTATTVYDDDGRPLRMLGASWDNTHLHRENETLASLSRRLALTQSATGLGFWTLDLTNRRLSMDDNCLRIFGFASPSQLPGNPDDLTRTVHPDDSERVVRELGQALTAPTECRLEYRVRRPSGEERNLRTWVLVVRATGSGAARLVVGATLDVTREVRDQGQLRSATERLQAMSELVRIGRWQYDPVQDRFEPDPNFEALLGLDSGAMGTTLDEVLARVRDEQRPRLRAMIHDLLARGSEISLEYDAHFPDGRQAHLLVRGTVRRDPDGLAILAEGGVMDISRLQSAMKQPPDAHPH